jgi:hypothetical protein
MTESERLHAGLRTVFAELCSLYDTARFEQREGYDLTVFPPVALAQFNGVWPFADTAASELQGALAEIEATAAAGFDAPLSIFEPLHGRSRRARKHRLFPRPRRRQSRVDVSRARREWDRRRLQRRKAAEHRGRGFGAALTTAAARDGFAKGADLA